jgi:hypothetical protein
MMLTAWHTSSQSDIHKDSVVISKEVARKALIDLADYDRLRENNVEANLANCIEIQKEKDTLIDYISQQNNFYQETLRITDEQLKIREDQLKTAKGKNGGGFLLAVGGLLIGLVFGVGLAN